MHVVAPYLYHFMKLFNTTLNPGQHLKSTASANCHSLPVVHSMVHTTIHHQMWCPYTSFDAYGSQIPQGIYFISCRLQFVTWFSRQPFSILRLCNRVMLVFNIHNHFHTCPARFSKLVNNQPFTIWSNCKMMPIEVAMEMLDDHNHSPEFSVGHILLLLLFGQCTL